MPLTFANRGEINQIKKITGRDEVRQHLSNLGFVEGAEVTIINEVARSVICNVKGARVALSKSMAGRILI
ncbi:MAG: FeoA family protein [Clostridia bacterium]|nr:FeoA family protein [Clostridia bacterium]